MAAGREDPPGCFVFLENEGPRVERNEVLWISAALGEAKEGVTEGASEVYI